MLTSDPPLVTNFSSHAVYLSQSADDQTAVTRCLAGDAAAFEQIVRRYQQVLFTVALRMLGDEEEARDAAQNAFLKAFEKLGSYDGRRRFFSWIYRILVNECLNARRKPMRVRALESVEESAAMEAAAPDAAEAAERRTAVKKAILELPEPYREVIVLRHFAALSYDEMSDAIGVPAKTVKSRLYSARQLLAERLAAWM